MSQQPPEQPWQGQQPPYGYQQPYPYYQPPPWRPPPPIDPKQLRPSRLWYLLAPLPALVGIALAIVFVLKLVEVFDTDLDHLRPPARVELSLDAGERRAIYVQTVGAAGASLASVADISCSVQETGGARDLPLDTSSGFTLTLGSDEYVQRLTFEALAAGRYVVACTRPEGVPLAVGPELSLRSFVVPIAGAILSFLIGLAATAAIAIVVAVKRSNHKQRLQREAMSGY